MQPLSEGANSRHERTERYRREAALVRTIAEATLDLPAGTWMQGADGRGGKQGVHTEHIGPMLAQMQWLQRAYPGAQW